MFSMKLIGWIALVFFIISTMILGFLFLFTFLSAVNINGQFILLIAGVFALAAAVTGFSSLSTMTGKVGGIGGLALTVVVTLVLIFSAITHVERGTAQLPLATSTTPLVPSPTHFMVGATAAPYPIVTQNLVNAKSYHNSTIGFELDYPSGWIIDTRNESSGMVIL